MFINHILKKTLFSAPLLINLILRTYPQKNDFTFESHYGVVLELEVLVGAMLIVIN